MLIALVVALGFALIALGVATSASFLAMVVAIVLNMAGVVDGPTTWTIAKLWMGLAALSAVSWGTLAFIRD